MARKTAKYKTEFDKVERLQEGYRRPGGEDGWVNLDGHLTLDIGHWTEGNGAEEVRPGKLLFFMGIANARLFARQTVEKKLSVCLYPY